MKQVAIVTPETLTPRSFLWDETSERFKVKINNVVENSLVQEEDGLYVLGDINAQPFINDPKRYRLSDNVFDLPDLTISLVDGNIESNVRIVTKTAIDELSIQKITNNENTNDLFLNLNPEDPKNLWVENTFRIAYIKQGNVVVMDVFLIRGSIHDGFVDVIVNAKMEDFPPVDSNGIVE